MAIATINPATGTLIQPYEALTAAAIDQRLTQAQQGFQTYRTTSFEQRSHWLHQVAEILETQKQAYGELMTLEVGKPIKSAIAEVEKCAWVCRFYADQGAAFLQDDVTETDASRSFVRYQPLGAVLAVMPWNFPFWQVLRFAAPTLMAGNVALLKHASNVPQCALAIEEILAKAGFPPGVFQTLLVGADAVANIIQDDRVQAATLTGSEPAGASLAAAAGKAIKPTLLELGGSDPFIVMPSADIEQAAATAVTARMLNNGQSCIAAKRFILHDAIADQFLVLLVEKFRALTVGDPRDAAIDVGPLATPSIRDELAQQVQACVDAGAKALVGGNLPALQAQLPESLRGGSFYPPTVLADIPPGTPADQEEFFGPVALTFRVPDWDSALALANSTSLGLGASVWTADSSEQERAIAELEAGAVFINGLVKSDPRLPFGGIKRSGYGRELGQPGIRAFVNAKTVWIR
ncbi:NAD-dependent succinate-semialdehyde dehydrogenase [Leptolyngbya sp. PCC 6406]|uniref:NAD-dependent succinate-semialdehyde dehydrogenase n=1 Tax=Leptolyngbya sp. PCC 6406 TaxID=1173264 RepID=UPI0002AC5D18|nr:NAD-dependent succinate-semialdehyde dehydrogenase [Leptolyngbya sp. PCC 6406]